MNNVGMVLDYTQSAVVCGFAVIWVAYTLRPPSFLESC